MKRPVEEVARALARLSLDFQGNDAPVTFEGIVDRRWKNFIPQSIAALNTLSRLGFLNDNYFVAKKAEEAGDAGRGT